LNTIPNEIAAIRDAALQVFGPGVRVWLFGSRTRPDARGGDIDLLITPPQKCHDPADALHRKIRFLGLLEQSLGEQKLDVIIESPGDARPIVRIAHETGIEL
jgi:predicted nucleotidyltransferase